MAAIRIAMDSDRLKRLQAQGQQITPTRAPSSPMPTNKPSGMQMLGNYVADKAAKEYGGPLVDKGLAKLTGMFTPAAAAPIAQAGTGMAPGMAQAVLGSGSASAPLVAAQAGAPMSVAMKGGAAALAPTAAAGTGAGLMGSLGSMGTAAMASPLAPIIGGFALAKMLGFFSKGGHVGPLHASTGSVVSTPQGISPPANDPNTPENEYQAFIDNYDPNTFGPLGPKNPIPLPIDNNVYQTGYTGFRTKGSTSDFNFGNYDDDPTVPRFDLEDTIDVLQSDNNYDTAVTDSSFPYADPLDGAFEKLNSGGGPYTIFPAEGPQVSYDISELTPGQINSLYYNSPAGVDASGNLHGKEDEYTINPSMWYLNPEYNKDPANQSQYVKVGGGFDPTNMNSVNYDVRADIDAGGGR